MTSRRIGKTILSTMARINEVIVVITCCVAAAVAGLIAVQPPAAESPCTPPGVTVLTDPAGDTSSGLVYSGTLSIAPVSLTASYANDLRLVTVQLNWTNGLPRQRQLSTYVCRTGMQNYFY